EPAAEAAAAKDEVVTGRAQLVHISTPKTGYQLRVVNIHNFDHSAEELNNTAEATWLRYDSLTYMLLPPDAVAAWWLRTWTSRRRWRLWRQTMRSIARFIWRQDMWTARKLIHLSDLGKKYLSVDGDRDIETIRETLERRLAPSWTGFRSQDHAEYLGTFIGPGASLALIWDASHHKCVSRWKRTSFAPLSAMGAGPREKQSRLVGHPRIHGCRGLGTAPLRFEGVEGPAAAVGGADLSALFGRDGSAPPAPTAAPAGPRAGGATGPRLLGPVAARPSCGHGSATRAGARVAVSRRGPSVPLGAGVAAMAVAAAAADAIEAAFARLAAQWIAQLSKSAELGAAGAGARGCALEACATGVAEEADLYSALPVLMRILVRASLVTGLVMNLAKCVIVFYRRYNYMFAHIILGLLGLASLVARGQLDGCRDEDAQQMGKGAPQKFQRVRGGGRAPGRDDIDLVGPVISLQKLGLRQDLKSREHEHMLRLFYLVPKTSCAAKKGLQGGQDYYAAVASRGRGRRLGAPYLHAAVAAFDGLIEDCSDGAHKDVLMAYQKLFNQESGPHFVKEIFGMFKLKEAYSEDGAEEKDIQVKVDIHINPMADVEMLVECMKVKVEGQIPPIGILRRAILKAFVQAGAQAGEGPGPKDELARVVERQLHGLCIKAKSPQPLHIVDFLSDPLPDHLGRVGAALDPHGAAAATFDSLKNQLADRRLQNHEEAWHLADKLTKKLKTVANDMLTMQERVMNEGLQKTIPAVTADPVWAAHVSTRASSPASQRTSLYSLARPFADPQADSDGAYFDSLMKSLRVPACVNEFAQRLEATPLDPMPECPVESRAGPKKYPVSGLIAGQISR
ncbi:unnamed protein product, partial [Prorocentrum cordatum]